MSSSETDPNEGDLLADAGAEAAALKDFARRILDLPDGAPPPPELVQQGITALTRLYTVKFQLGERWDPFTGPGAVPVTAVMIMATAMMRNVNVELFELGMWQSFSGV